MTLLKLTLLLSFQCLRDVRIHHLRLLLVLCQIATVVLFPVWMYTDVWYIITQLHKVGYLEQMLGMYLYPIIVGNIQGENFHEFCGLGATRDSFLHKNFEHVTPTYTTSLAFHKSFSMKCSLSIYRFAKVLWNMCQ